MAVTLEFQVDQDVLANDRQYDPVAADPGVIETTYFMMPVRFSIDGRELLKTPTSAWMPLPVLGFATHLFLCLGALGSTGAATCSVSGAGTLRFERHGEQIRAICSFNDVEAEIPVEELEVAIIRFHGHVRDSFRELVPELIEHPSWPSWFPSDER